ncbi:MAG: purine-nucleoside phosphorylase [Verrucomicrobiales bacterium]|jgi:purine-nucleoside phosphorylase
MLPAQFEDYAPEIGLVLGSGLGSFADSLDVAHVIPFCKIEGLPQSTVPGHEGRFLLGSMADRRLIVAQGRVHLYEGKSAHEVTSGIRLMAATGIETLILTNAAGVLNPQMRPGEWMALTDHLNLTGTSPLVGGANFVDMTHVYDSKLRQEFMDAADACGTRIFAGVYAGLLGPQYETPAEVRMLGKLGADAVGMSTVLEAIQARALGLRVAGFSCLTNWAAGISPDPLSHEEVLETGGAAAERFLTVLKRVLASD